MATSRVALTGSADSSWQGTMHTKVCVPGWDAPALRPPGIPLLAQASVRKQLRVSFSGLNRRPHTDFESRQMLRKMGRAEGSEHRIG